MRVVVEEYNPAWAQQFQELKGGLEAILQGVEYVSIEHVGSTSVPGLAAKPILDIDIVIKTPAHLEAVRQALVEKGKYAYMGEWGVPDRHAFRNDKEVPRRNLYVCPQGSQNLRNHIMVRDICRRDPTIRDAYGRKKVELAQQEWSSLDEYCEAKNEILLYMLEQAGMSKDELTEIRTINTLTT